jgi:hypothetical protein
MWRSLIFGDVAGIKQHAVSMNAGDLPELFASMLTMQPWDRIARGQLHALPKVGNADVVRIAGDGARLPRLQSADAHTAKGRQ